MKTHIATTWQTFVKLQQKQQQKTYIFFADFPNHQAIAMNLPHDVVGIFGRIRSICSVAEANNFRFPILLFQVVYTLRARGVNTSMKERLTNP